MDRPTPTGVERFFDEGELIVSKTDLQGKITYANNVFQRVSGYRECELIGKPHSLIRHPSMPRCVFRLLWERIEAGHEVFAYVVNLCKNGDHYWVLAHVTPTHDSGGRITGYHSNRRVPTRAALDRIEPLYHELLEVERRHRLPKDQWGASLPALVERLESLGVTYDEFVFSLCAPREQEAVLS
ncbi:MAG: PAS domain-containing protein [Phycisphaerales bacterium]